MQLVLVIAAVALAAVAAAGAGLAAQASRSLAACRDELAALAQLRTAHDLLVGDLERTRRHLDRPAEVWPSGPGR